MARKKKSGSRRRKGLFGGTMSISRFALGANLVYRSIAGRPGVYDGIAEMIRQKKPMNAAYNGFIGSPLAELTGIKLLMNSSYSEPRYDGFEIKYPLENGAIYFGGRIAHRVAGKVGLNGLARRLGSPVVV